MVDRIRKLIAYEQMNSSQFADEIKLQRSSLSHVLSGRNNPSLDFVMKIKQRFPEVNLEWLLFGEGNMLLGEQNNIVFGTVNDSGDSKLENIGRTISNNSETKVEYSGRYEETGTQTQNLKNFGLTGTSGTVQTVIVFFNNGTFEEYSKRKA